MTLPVELLQRRPAAERYDVAVVGGGVAGLAAGAILARAGVRVVLLEAAKRPGGQVQTIAHQGFAVDLGPLLWEEAGFGDVLTAAGVGDLALAEVRSRESLRIAIVRPRAERLESAPLPVPGAVPSPSVLDAVRALYGVAPRVFAQLGAIFEELGSAGADQLEDWRDTTLGAWLAERGTEAVVAGAARRSVELLGALAPETASLAVVAQRAQALRREPRASWLTVGDNPVAGTRGLVQALTDAFIEAGGELRLGTRALGLAFDRERFRAVAVQREEHPFADEVVAEHCILALPSREIATLVPAALRGAVAGGVDNSRPGTLGIAWGMRGEGGGESARGHLVRLIAPPRAAREVVEPGTLDTSVLLAWPSALAPRIAPPGAALLVAHAALAADGGRDLEEAARVLALVRTAVRDLYAISADGLLWERHWLKPGAAHDPFVLPRLAATLPACEGVLLAGADVATPGVLATGIAAAALSGKAAAEKILAPVAR